MTTLKVANHPAPPNDIPHLCHSPRRFQPTHRAIAGLAMVEIVGFRGQTAPTTRIEIKTAPTTTYMKTNYLTISATDSGAVLVA